MTDTRTINSKLVPQCHYVKAAFIDCYRLTFIADLWRL